ncbi:hypothetical protein SAMN05216359_10677 [Roseateles sp. YR242]|uniref:hypothetical protein n=1 Tax=Roseateles sp. YR242 TaxID=1855305 RepID=UPI0008C42384|nr:hypothetical protein [Roseateles sp. YR242]SEL18902.1 hypothetical protein SAMN05216359_10677 [Roseateles sp. YR242]
MARSTTPEAPERAEPGSAPGARQSPDHLLDKPPVAPGTATGAGDAKGAGAKGPSAKGSSENAGAGTASPDDGDLQLPHERDQSVGRDSTGAMGTGAAGEQQREVLQQAHRDLQQGQVDTDMRATPGLDAQRRNDMVDDPKGAPAPSGSVAGHDKKKGQP